MKLQRFEFALLTIAAGCAAFAGWEWWHDRPQLAFAARHELVGLTVHQPQQFVLELRNEGDTPRKVIGARAY
jgi:hypothetical protein